MNIRGGIIWWAIMETVWVTVTPDGIEGFDEQMGIPRLVTQIRYLSVPSYLHFRHSLISLLRTRG
jgi:hypothetical protein